MSNNWCLHCATCKVDSRDSWSQGPREASFVAKCAVAIRALVLEMSSCARSTKTEYDLKINVLCEEVDIDFLTEHGLHDIRVRDEYGRICMPAGSTARDALLSYDVSVRTEGELF